MTILAPPRAGKYQSMLDTLKIRLEAGEHVQMRFTSRARLSHMLRRLLEMGLRPEAQERLHVDVAIL